jgi:hypothetical protein
MTTDRSLSNRSIDGRRDGFRGRRSFARGFLPKEFQQNLARRVRQFQCCIDGCNGLRSYLTTKVVFMSRDTTTWCRYCGRVYYVEKQAAHEEICSSMPRSSRLAPGNLRLKG